MRFKGQLLLPDEPGPGLRVNLDVAEHHLAVESDDGGLGAWPLEVIDVERLQGDVFALTVAGEPLQFVAEDTIGFAYSGVPVIEKAPSRRPRGRSALRSMFDRIWNGPEESESSDAVQPESSDPVQSGATEEQGVTEEQPGGPGLLERILALDPAPAREPEVVEDASHPVVESPRPVVESPRPVEPSEETIDAPPDPSPLGEDRSGSAVCPGTTSDGRPCESQILTSSGHCYAHDPKRAFEDKYKAAQEAREQLKRDATARLNRIYSRLDKAMRQVERGELEPETATAMAQLARTMCAILDMDETPSE